MPFHYLAVALAYIDNMVKRDSGAIASYVLLLLNHYISHIDEESVIDPRILVV